MIIEVIADYRPEDLDLKGDVDIQIHTDIEGTDLPPGMEEELKEMLDQMMLEVEVEMKDKARGEKKRSTQKKSKKEANKKGIRNQDSKKMSAKEKASKKKNAGKKNAGKKNAGKKNADKKNADKKKRSGGAVRKSDTGSSMEIRVRELSSLGVPVF